MIGALINTFVKIKKLEEKKKAIIHENLSIDNDKPIVFIGGSPRSGTTLLRVMLDSHRDLNCGDETKIIPMFIESMRERFKNPPENNDLNRNGISREIFDAGTKAYIYEILERHSNYTPVLCAKDPIILSHTVYLSKLFPTSQFIFMIRDARAVMPSISYRGVSLGGFGTDFKQNFKIWNELVENMYNQCVMVGSRRCLSVYYEQLVLHPEVEMKKILKFLNVEWSDAVLHHEDYFGSKIKISDHAKSADQVIKPINIEALYDWVGKIPQDVLDKLDTIAPMLKKLGYDTKSSKPYYGKPDLKILDNTFEIQANVEKWIQLKKNFSVYARIGMI